VSIQLIRSTPLTRFADLTRLNKARLLRAYIVSPWIVAPEVDEFVPLVTTILSIRESRARLTVVTRPPDQAGHQRALNLLAKLPQVEILFLKSLHAKLYLLECNGLRAGLFGSPNFTPQGDTENLELAADIRSVRSSDIAAEFLENLFGFVRELMADSDSRFFKRVGEVIN